MPKRKFNMTSKIILTTLLSVGLTFSIYKGFTGTENSTGMTGSTGAPGETTCASCHTPASGGSGSVNISGDFINSEYVANQTYNISVTITHSGSSKFGFNLVALDSSNASVGTITAGAGTQVMNGPLSRQNITHTNAGTGTTTPGSKIFNFTWTAPASYAGIITFYAAGNATNNDGNNTGDFVYTTTFSINGNPITLLEADLYSDFQISPNPILSGNVLHVQVPENFNRLSLTDLSGRTFIRSTWEQGINTLKVPSAGLQTGIYLLVIENDSKRLVKRLIIQK